MKRMLLGVVIAIALVGCDTFKDMTEVSAKQELVQDAIEEKTGWESQVGFNIHNGVLTNVSVTLNASDVRNRRVSELEGIVRNAVLESFKSKPQVIVIQIAMTDES